MSIENKYSLSKDLIFGFDTGYPLIEKYQISTKFYKGLPLFNVAKPLNTWPTKSNVSITIYTGSVKPPIEGEEIYLLTKTTDNSTLIRDGGYYQAGGWDHSPAASTNLDLLSDDATNYTPVGDNKFRFGMYVMSLPDTNASTSLTIDIGDKNSKLLSNIENLKEWYYHETDDSLGINSQYPYDFFDIFYSGLTGNKILISGLQILRTPDSTAQTLKTPGKVSTFLGSKQSISYSNSLIDLTRNNIINISNTEQGDNGLFKFNGTTNYIPFPTGTFDFTNKSFSIETWIYWDGDSTDTFFGHHHASAAKESIHFRIYDTGQLRLDFYASSVNTVSGIVIPNKWNHIVFTYEVGSQNGVLYVNNILKAQATIGPFIADSSLSTTYIGVHYPTLQPFGGYISLFKIYNRPLNTIEIENNFKKDRNRFNI